MDALACERATRSLLMASAEADAQGDLAFDRWQRILSHHPEICLKGLRLAASFHGFFQVLFRMTATMEHQGHMKKGRLSCRS